MLSKSHVTLTSTLLLFQQISAINSEGADLTARLANDLEAKPQSSNMYNWSTAVPEPGPIVVVDGVTMPPRALVMSHEGSAASIWGPGTFFDWEQCSAVSGQNYTHHEQILAKR